MLWLLFTFLYVQTGFQLGKKGAKVWKKGDNDSNESFLFFPVSHARGKVGEPDMPFMRGINDSESFFRTLTTLGWPVWAVWNLLVIGGLLGPDKVIRRLTGEKKADRYKALEAAILKDEKRVDKVIRRLEAPKKPRKPRQSKATKALAAPPPVFAQPPPVTHAAAPEIEQLKEQLGHGDAQKAEVADPPPPPVQVRVTVDVTAPGPVAEEVDSSDADRRVNTLTEREKVVH